MSDVQKRDQFRTRLKCARCGKEGHAVWEETILTSRAGRISRLLSLEGEFLQQPEPNPQRQPVIACKTCGTVQPD